MRLLMLLLGILYTLLLFICYVEYLSPIWGYMGYPPYDSRRTGDVVVLGVLLAGLTAAILPPKISRYSHFVCWVLFFLTYAPIVVIVPLQGLLEDGGVVLIVTVTASFLVMFVLSEILSNKQRQVGWSSWQEGENPYLERLINRGFDRMLIGVWCVVTVVIFGTTRVELNLDNILDFQDIYRRRSELAELQRGIPGLAYIVQWSANVLGPLLVAVGLFERRWGLTAIGTANQVLLFLLGGFKYLPPSVLLMIALYAVVLRHKQLGAHRMAVIFGGGLAALLAIAALSEDARAGGGIMARIVSQGLMRAFGNPGLLMGLYAQFFESHPWTWYAHSKPFSWLIEYPYDASVGKTVGLWWSGSDQYNATANVWATDGIAALGFWGVLLVGVVLGLILAVANRMVGSQKMRFVALASFVSVWGLADTYLSVALITWGWIFHLVLGRFRQVVGETVVVEAKRMCHGGIRRRRG